MSKNCACRQPKLWKDYIIQCVHRVQSVCRKLAGCYSGEEGRKAKGNKDVVIMDLPGIYSLSPYTLEEVVAEII